MPIGAPRHRGRLRQLCGHPFSAAFDRDDPDALGVGYRFTDGVAGGLAYAESNGSGGA